MFVAARSEGLLAETDDACVRSALRAAVAAGCSTVFVNVECEVFEGAPASLPSGLHGIIEVTERDILDKPAELLVALDHARAAGWGIAVDDIGAEWGSLALLPLLRPDIVKLDRGVLSSHPTPETARIVRAARAYVDRSGAILLAEGIEDRAHEQRARRAGCAAVSLASRMVLPRGRKVPQMTARQSATGCLDGAVALITGAAGTTGAATARRFAREGAKVVVTDVRRDDAGAIAAEIDGLALEHDVASDSSWRAALAATVDRFGGLTILVNNAGVGDSSGVLDQSLEVWDRLVAVNQTGVMLGIRHAAPAMGAAGGGSIVNVSSIHGLVARPEGSSSAAAYTATKGAVRLLTKAAASELAGAGIRVNSVHPGYIAVPMRGSEVTPERERARALTPMGRFAQPDEIAAGITFLASSEASYVTGAELVIDGGYTAV